MQKAARRDAGVMTKQPMNASVRERQREERERQFREQVKSGSLKLRKATVAERRAWKAES
jgi:hypothetical protein